MARTVVRTPGSAFVTAKTTPVVIAATPHTGFFMGPRHLVLELIPGNPVLFEDGGALQIKFGAGSLLDLPVDATFYGASVATIEIVDLAEVLTAPQNLANFINGPVKLGLKTSDINTKGGIAMATLGAGGTGYVAGDTVTVDGGAVLATVRVDTVAVGAVTAFTVLTIGSGYSVANNIATTAVTGIGTGFKVNITGISTSDGQIKSYLYHSLLVRG